jgi:hypothetical protein
MINFMPWTVREIYNFIGTIQIFLCPSQNVSANEYMINAQNLNVSDNLNIEKRGYLLITFCLHIRFLLQVLNTYIR